MNIKKVAVLGAGAVGSYVIWGLSNNKNITLGVVADGERNERLKNQGLMINGTKYTPQVWTPEEAHNVDLLIVSLKYGSLRGALQDIQTIVGENTTVMSLMNGVDSEEIIAEKIDKSHILYSFGELQQPYESERVKAVDDIFENTGLHWIITDDIQAEIWGKFKLNVCNNLPQAILGVGVGCYEDSEHMAAIRDGLRAEVEAVAKAKGIDLSMINAKSGRGSAVKASARYSTLQDIDSGRHTEIDMFSGAMMRMGKELGIPTPYNEYTYHMIKALEEKNDGVFEYQGENDRVSWSK